MYVRVAKAKTSLYLKLYRPRDKMKPKVGKSSSTSEIVKQKKPKKLKKIAGLCVTPISSFFKPLNVTKRVSSPVKSPPKTPTSSNTRRSPASRPSPVKRHGKLTPVKLGFQFDFTTKIPPVTPKKSPANPPSVCLPTPPLSRSPSPSTPKSQASHQSSPPSSTQAPPFSPIEPLSPETLEALKYSVETPLPPPKTPSRCNTPEKKERPPENIRHKVIVISSDSEMEVVCCQRPRKMSANRDIAIVINSSESEDLEIPISKRRKKVSIESVSQNTSSTRPLQIKTCTSVSNAPKIISVASKPSTHHSSPTQQLEKNAGNSKLITLKPPKSQHSKPASKSLEPTLKKQKLLKLPRCLLEKQDTAPVDRLSEVAALLWKRGTPHMTKCVSSTAKVFLFNRAQRTRVETYLDCDCRFLSDKLATLSGYLATVTSCTSIPRGENLAALFLLICDPHVSASRIHPTVRTALVRYFPRLLLVHPPGSHKAVDAQYRVFLTALVEKGKVFSLWELLLLLVRFTGHGSQLLSFLVDLLLSDYWATLHTDSGETPLFLRVFWACKESPRINPSVRELLKELANLLQTFTTSRENLLRLDSVCALLYLCGAVCVDLPDELLALCNSLPPSCVHLLLGRVHSLPLYSRLVLALPKEKMLIIPTSQQSIEQEIKELKPSEVIACEKNIKKGDYVKAKQFECKKLMSHLSRPSSVQNTLATNTLATNKTKPSAELSAACVEVSHGHSEFPHTNPRPAILKFSKQKSLKRCENCKKGTCTRCLKTF